MQEGQSLSIFYGGLKWPLVHILWFYETQKLCAVKKKKKKKMDGKACVHVLFCLPLTC